MKFKRKWLDYVLYNFVRRSGMLLWIFLQQCKIVNKIPNNVQTHKRFTRSLKISITIKHKKQTNLKKYLNFYSVAIVGCAKVKNFNAHSSQWKIMNLWSSHQQCINTRVHWNLETCMNTNIEDISWNHQKSFDLHMLGIFQLPLNNHPHFW